MEKPQVTPNHFGETEPWKKVCFNGNAYYLGGISSEAKIEPFLFGVTVYEFQRGSAFILYNDGRVFRHDLEDEKICTAGGALIFFSDAGMSMFVEGGELTCSFNDLNLYFTLVDFSLLERKKVSFYLPDERAVSMDVREIFETIGQLDLTYLVGDNSGGI